MPLSIDALGDRAILVTLGDVADEATRRRVLSCYERLVRQRPVGVTEIVPGFASVAIQYDPARLGRADAPSPHAAMAATIGELLRSVDTLAVTDKAPVEIPVCYDASFALDIADVAAHAGVTPEQVAAMHAAGEYVVHMVGFLPGFPYLGGLDPLLATPRRSSPRARVPAGSVAIGGSQTGIYTMESPGGWQVIGRTTARLFDVERDPPALLRIGDRVRFREISLDEYRAAVSP